MRAEKMFNYIELYHIYTIESIICTRFYCEITTLLYKLHLIKYNIDKELSLWK